MKHPCGECEKRKVEADRCPFYITCPAWYAWFHSKWEEVRAFEKNNNASKRGADGSGGDSN